MVSGNESRHLGRAALGLLADGIEPPPRAPHIQSMRVEPRIAHCLPSATTALQQSPLAKYITGLSGLVLLRAAFPMSVGLHAYVTIHHPRQQSALMLSPSLSRSSSSMRQGGPMRCLQGDIIPHRVAVACESGAVSTRWLHLQRRHSVLCLA